MGEGIGLRVDGTRISARQIGAWNWHAGYGIDLMGYDIGGASNESILNIDAAEYAGVGGNTGTAQTISIATYQWQSWVVNANCTFTMPSGLVSGKAISFGLILTDSGGPRNITFTGVKWPSGADPTAMSGSGKIDIFTFFTINGGTTWYGFIAGQGMAT